MYSWYSVHAWSLGVRNHFLTGRTCRFSFGVSRVWSSTTKSATDSVTQVDDNNTDPKLWQGASHSSSDFVTHVIAGLDKPTVVQAIQSAVKTQEGGNINHTNLVIPRDNTNLCAEHLLQFGSVWFLPQEAPRNPSLGAKPIRLTIENASKVLCEGDYLRIHHSPRRFPAVYNYNWKIKQQQSVKSDDKDEKPGVIVARNDDKGYLVIDKPAGVPVHSTVDNCLENVAQCIRNGASTKEEEEPYVSTPQRLDQNTSGLLVVSTKKSFAAYYAKLLRTKTDQQLNVSSAAANSAIHKRYKCLVCLLPPSHGDGTDGSGSVTSEMERLRAFTSENSTRVLRHYLEPSIRAPKRFARLPGNESWVECLLRIVSVDDLCPLVGTPAGQELANNLWRNPDSVPQGCVAVVEVEVEVELLTGRTHQIRGQLSTEGFPLVGDAQYGGAIALSEGRSGFPPVSPLTNYVNSDRLALQCSQLEFRDPDMVNQDDGTEVGILSNRWNSFSLKNAWWSPYLDRFHEHVETSDAATTSVTDQQQIKALQEMAATKRQPNERTREEVTVPRVQLSPGVHKYVLIRAKKRDDSKTETHWYVKSASPSECGGVYHANVAKELVEQLKDGDYDDVVVTGGGRIDFNEYAPHAHVYGFSYGFGKGDHALAASVIETDSNNTVVATYDTSNGLY